jgi:hypothetical protein
VDVDLRPFKLDAAIRMTLPARYHSCDCVRHRGKAMDVIDEQHRLGVDQRLLLAGKGKKLTCW